eukprot:5533511-Pleurochrysis_carterae.AAC.1
MDLLRCEQIEARRQAYTDRTTLSEEHEYRERGPAPSERARPKRWLSPSTLICPLALTSSCFAASFASAAPGLWRERAPRQALDQLPDALWTPAAAGASERESRLEQRVRACLPCAERVATRATVRVCKHASAIAPACKGSRANETSHVISPVSSEVRRRARSIAFVSARNLRTYCKAPLDTIAQ